MPSPKVRAAVFDMDGTLVDNMRFHLLAWVATGDKLGIDITAAQAERDFAGRKNEEIFPRLLGREISKVELEALAEEKEATYRALYANELVELRGASALMDRLTGAGITLAVASAAPPENRAFILDGLHWRSRFAAIIGAEDVSRGKPSPDLFLAAAVALGVAPAECIAFEDAVNGVKAAREAGMRVAGVMSTTPAEVLREAGATWTIHDFTALPAELEQAIFGG